MDKILEVFLNENISEYFFYKTRNMAYSVEINMSFSYESK